MSDIHALRVRTPWTRSTTSSAPASSVTSPAAPAAARRWRACARLGRAGRRRDDHSAARAARRRAARHLPGPALPADHGGGPVHRRKWFPALVAAVVLALVGVGGAVWQPWRDDSSVTVSVADQVLQDPAAQRFTKELGGGARPPSSAPPSSTAPSSSPRTCPPAPDGKVYQLWLQTPQPAHELGRPDAGRGRHGALRRRRRRRRRGRGVARAGRRVRAADQGRRPVRLRGHVTMGGTEGHGSSPWSAPAWPA